MVFMRNFDLSKTSICRHRAKIPLILRFVRLRVFLELELLARYPMKLEQRNFYEYCISCAFKNNPWYLCVISICRGRVFVDIVQKSLLYCALSV